MTEPKNEYRYADNRCLSVVDPDAHDLLKNLSGLRLSSTKAVCARSGRENSLILRARRKKSMYMAGDHMPITPGEDQKRVALYQHGRLKMGRFVLTGVLIMH